MTLIRDGRLVDPIQCKSFHSRLSARACATNMEMALRAFSMLEDGVSIFLICEYDLDRLMYCSKCSLFPTYLVKPTNQLLFSALTKLADKVTRYNEYGHDPDLSAIRRRERQKRYRERHADQIRINKRLNHLEQQLRKLTGEG